jgi:hypothetical protein
MSKLLAVEYPMAPLSTDLPSGPLPVFPVIRVLKPTSILEGDAQTSHLAEMTLFIKESNLNGSVS